MGYTIKDFDSIVADMVAYIVANSSQITDLSPGSVIRSFCEGSALSIEELYVSVYLGFKRYLNQVKTDVFGLQKKSGVKASTNVIFSRTSSSGQVTIPAGTRLQTSASLVFATTSESYILDGHVDSDPTEVEAESVGVAYNVSSDTITTMKDNVDGVETVTNPNAATGGVDIETDYNFEKRFQQYIEGIGRVNRAGLRYAALSVEGITSVSIEELIPPVSNVNVKVYIDDGSALSVSAAKIEEVQDVIDGDGTESNPGYRAAGINVVVSAPGIVTQDVTCTITVVPGVDIDQVESDTADSITNYINKLDVADDIILNEIVASIMQVYGIFDCDVSDPTGNVAIAASQIGRVGTIAITVV